MPLFDPSTFSYLITSLLAEGQQRKASPVLSEQISGEVLLALAKVFSDIDDADQPADSPRDRGGIRRDPEDGRLKDRFGNER